MRREHHDKVQGVHPVRGAAKAQLDHLRAIRGVDDMQTRDPLAPHRVIGHQGQIAALVRGHRHRPGPRLSAFGAEYQIALVLAEAQIEVPARAGIAHRHPGQRGPGDRRPAAQDGEGLALAEARRILDTYLYLQTRGGAQRYARAGLDIAAGARGAIQGQRQGVGRRAVKVQRAVHRQGVRAQGQGRARRRVVQGQRSRDRQLGPLERQRRTRAQGHGPGVNGLLEARAGVGDVDRGQLGVRRTADGALQVEVEVLDVQAAGAVTVGGNRGGHGVRRSAAHGRAEGARAVVQAVTQSKGAAVQGDALGLDRAQQPHRPRASRGQDELLQGFGRLITGRGAEVTQHVGGATVAKAQRALAAVGGGDVQLMEQVTATRRRAVQRRGARGVEVQAVSADAAAENDRAGAVDLDLFEPEDFDLPGPEQASRRSREHPGGRQGGADARGDSAVPRKGQSALLIAACSDRNVLALTLDKARADPAVGGHAEAIIPAELDAMAHAEGVQ